MSKLLSGDIVVPDDDAITPRGKGLRLGVIFLLAALVLAPVFGAFHAPPSMAGGTIATLVMLGIARIIYAMAFESGKPKRRPVDVRPTFHAANQSALPPAYTPPAMTGVSRPATTGELVMPSSERVAPPSVTEHTTRFLERDRERQ